MAKASLKQPAEKPTTVVSGNTVEVTGTKTGAITLAQQAAKAARLRGSPAPASAGGYKGSQSIRALDSDESLPPREGSQRHKAFVAMIKCKTVGEYVLTGFKVKYLKAFVKRGLVRIS